MAISELDRAILDLEASWWTVGVAKSDQIRARLRISPPDYYRRLRQLVDDPDAAVVAPLVVRRLRRRRADELNYRMAQEGLGTS